MPWMVPSRMLELYPESGPGIDAPPETKFAPTGLAQIGWTYDGELLGQYAFNTTTGKGWDGWTGFPNTTMPYTNPEATLRRHYFAAVSATDELVRTYVLRMCSSLFVWVYKCMYVCMYVCMPRVVKNANANQNAEMCPVPCSAMDPDPDPNFKASARARVNSTCIRINLFQTSCQCANAYDSATDNADANANANGNPSTTIIPMLRSPAVAV